MTQIYQCNNCGRNFLLLKTEREYFNHRGWTFPKNCPECRRKKREDHRKAAEEIEKIHQNEERRVQWQKDQAEFERKLKDWDVIPIESIKLESEKTLFVIGNGFDLMHGVKSSYYSFRDFMGQHDEVRQTLEDFFKSADIWADLEDGLAHFDLNRMCGSMMMDNWLDINDAYGIDARATEFTMAVEYAVEPLRIISNELPKRLRQWVKTLVVGTEDRPLQALFDSGKGVVLSFNYTEFVEQLYGVLSANVCYIHGCRRTEKNKRPDQLILGHQPGKSEEAYELPNERVWKRNRFNRQLVEAAQEMAIRLASEYDKDLTKDCDEIIRQHDCFWIRLGSIGNVVTVGHSLSPVDWDYFITVRNSVSSDAEWYFGCHGLRDITNLESLVKHLGIPSEHIHVFRTDLICVSIKNRASNDNPKVVKKPQKRLLNTGNNGKLVAYVIGRTLQVYDKETQRSSFEAVLFAPPKRVIFLPTNEHLLVILNDLDSTVLLIYLTGGEPIVNELEPIQNQGLFNRRLKHLFINENRLTFVYNSRIREYDLSDGSLKKNQAVREAPQKHYDGVDVLTIV